MTKYPLTCKKCGYEFDKDQPPPPNAKPRVNPEDLEPSGVLTTEFVDNTVCPKCGNKGTKYGWRGRNPSQS